MEEKTESLFEKAERILSQYGDEQIINRSTAIEAIKEVLMSKEKEEKKRYFIVFYITDKGEIGNAGVESNGSFLRRKEISERLSGENGKAAITSINELSDSDYQDWIKE